MPSAGVEAEEPVGGERAAAKHRVAGSRGGGDGELRVLEPPLDTLHEAHQPGEVQVDLGDEVVVGRLGEGGLERDRVASRGVATIRASWMRTTARSSARRRVRCEPAPGGLRPLEVRCDVVAVGGEEQPASLVRRRASRGVNRTASSASSAAAGGAPRACAARAAASTIAAISAVRADRRDGEMSRTLLLARDDLRQTSVERSSRRLRLARGRRPSRAGDE